MTSTFQDPAVKTWLNEFEAAWDEGRLTARAAELPPPGHPNRLPLLTGMVGIDLRRRWRCGKPVALESYLTTYPELGTPRTASLDLLHAEYAARLECGAPADVAEFARRFSRNPAEVAQRFQPTQAAPAVHEAATLAPAATPSPAPVRFGGLPEHFGRYHILKQLGRGGMGAVYLANDGHLDRLVALKVPHFSPDDATALERFHREAKAAATLTHPNLCPVYDVGAIDGVHYLTMPYIEGRPLSDLVRSDMPEAYAADLVRRLALALEGAHQKGIIHRDLKPGNIMLNERGDPVVMDFGLARRANRDDVRLTQSGIVVGTPAYMPPEQLEGAGAPLGPACDVYALGVILYELLTARLPFQGTMAQLVCQVMMDPPPPPSQHRPGLDFRLDDICLKALAKKPEQRYPSMAALAAELQRYLSEPRPAVFTAEPVEDSTALVERPPMRRKHDDDDKTLPRRRRRVYEDVDAYDRPRGPERTSGKAVAALVLGLLIFCLHIFAGIPAIILAVLSLRDIKRERGRLGGKGLAIAGLVLGCFSLFGLLLIPVLFGLLLPATQKVREAAVRVETSSKLKQIAQGMHNDALSNGGKMVAPAICGKTGKPLLSWRVALLPYVGQENLYHQFKLDEPWDGPNNVRLVTRMPQVYAYESAKGAQGGQTYFRVFTGPQTPFPDPVPPFENHRSSFVFPGGFMDGTANTILVVEAADPVTWTKPDELPYDPNKPLPRLGGHHPGGIVVALADGSVRVLRADLSEQTLRAAITPAGGELLGPDWSKE
jgi:predicted Ser/Thr protein kinase